MKSTSKLAGRLALLLSVFTTGASLMSTQNIHAMPVDPAKVVAAVLALPAFSEELQWMGTNEINRIEIKPVQLSDKFPVDPKAYCAEQGGESRSATIIALIGWQDKYKKPSVIREVRFFATAENAEDVKFCSEK